MTQACANQLIQDAIMFRFLLFSGQTTMTWQDEIHFTEKMGDGEAFPDSKSANRKFHPKVPDERLGYFSNDPNEGLMYQGKNKSILGLLLTMNITTAHRT